MRAEANTPAFKAEWLVAANKHPFVADPAGPSMALAYSDHAERYFGPGTELENLKWPPANNCLIPGEDERDVRLHCG